MDQSAWKLELPNNILWNPHIGEFSQICGTVYKISQKAHYSIK